LKIVVRLIWNLQVLDDAGGMEAQRRALNRIRVERRVPGDVE